MPGPKQKVVAFNRTRHVFLATDLTVADTHWRRLLGLIGTPTEQFGPGRGLWIVPCRGIHTLAMRYPIDALYLNRDQIVVHLVEGLRPWRFAALRMEAATVLEVPANTLRETGTSLGDEIQIAAHPAKEAEPA